MLKEEELDTLKALQNPIWVYDVERFRIHWANEQAMSFWEAESAAELYSRDFSENMSEAIYTLLKNDLKGFRNGKEHTQWWTLFPKQKRKEVYCHYSGILLNDGRVAMLAQVVVTKELLETELSIHSSTTIASLWDNDGYLKSANPMFIEIYGKKKMRFADLFFSEHQAHEVWSTALEVREHEVELYLPTVHGSRWYGLQIRVNQTKDGNQFVLRQYDVTERKQRELEHRQLAVIDPLTKLSNRYGLMKRLEEMIDRGAAFSLFFIDLDNFKTINDYYGHNQGDRLLNILAERLSFRFSEASCIARLGGDEFLIADLVVDHADLDGMAKNLMQAICEPFMLEELGELQISASVGIVRFPEDGFIIDDLLRHADAAMYSAKGRGKSQYIYFSKQMSDEVNRRHRMRQLLSKAICDEEFSANFSPVVDTYQQGIVAYESALTWTNAELGVISADEFYPVAKECGMAALIGFMGLEQSCQGLMKFNRKGLNYQLLISISSSQLFGGNFVASLKKLLNTIECSPESIIIALNEAHLADPKADLFVLHQLRELGVNLLAEGFGAGRSSLSLLQQVPVTHIKLDRQLVEDIETSSHSVVRAALSMSTSMGLVVIAEGVTRETQLQKLQGLGCYICTGSLFKEAPESNLYNQLDPSVGARFTLPLRDDLP
ncbi:bifunctional diguanylate cyclase/phosphodiesterase [Neptunomonas concharum]|uniref:EAL domain-containing protein n=1 Tax=Neptunomonas concharum TaxID=1031538 RepID=A0A5P1RAY1_9GAMM|nr:bifunctional diguanylate cyclase/phosphodiesterase [Neptunomonas concharum]QEQ96768.1 EAL domain-containing protein [Neptunomonas concharum]